MSVIEITKETEFIIVASDGVWDTINDQEAITFVKQCKDLGVATQSLTEIAILRGSQDNILVKVISLVE